MSIVNIKTTSKCQRGGLSPDTGRNRAQSGPEARIPDVKPRRLNHSGNICQHEHVCVKAGILSVLEAVDPSTFLRSRIRRLENGSTVPAPPCQI